jgi:hypothetical protein
MRLRGEKEMQENGRSNNIQKCCCMNDRNGIVWLRQRNSEVMGWWRGDKGKDVPYIYERTVCCAEFRNVQKCKRGGIIFLVRNG